MTFSIKGILQIIILFGFSFMGTWIQNILQIPIPGSIIGLLLLLAALSLKIVKVPWIQQGSSYLLAMLPLLLVPAMIGIMNYPELFTGSGVFLFIIIVASTLATIVVTAKTSQYLEIRARQRKEKKLCMKNLSQ